MRLSIQVTADWQSLDPAERNRLRAALLRSVSRAGLHDAKVRYSERNVSFDWRGLLAKLAISNS
jgi:hypothetical protein